MTTQIEIPLRDPGRNPVDLWRTLQSHGVASLSPNVVDLEQRSLVTTVRVPRGRPRVIRVQEGRRNRAVVTVFGPRPAQTTLDSIAGTVRHLLRLDADLTDLYRRLAKDADLAWAARGAGRMMRSPTVFEDVVKTICTTNCAWSATVRMVNALVENLGEPAAGREGHRAFPSPAAMSEVSLGFYRDVVRAGYRGAYLRRLATDVAAGDVDLEALGDVSPEEMSDDEVEASLLALPGVGPYAAAHIMMMLGRHSRLILDSWTRPTYARLVGRKKVPDASIVRRFQPYGRHAGLAFWLFLTRDWVAD